MLTSGEAFSFEGSFVVNPDPHEPLLKVGERVMIGCDAYRVSAYANEYGVQTFRLEPDMGCRTMSKKKFGGKRGGRGC